MKKTFLIVFAILAISDISLFAQDKVVKSIIQIGQSDNRTMNHTSVVTAVVVYGVANLDHLLSRQGLYVEESKPAK